MQLSKAGVPRQIVDQFGSSQALSGGNVTSVGVDLGKQILSQVPEQFRPLVAPVIPRIVAGIHEAFSLAISDALWFGVVAAAIGVVLVTTLLPELPLRGQVGEAAQSSDVGGPAPIAAFD